MTFEGVARKIQIGDVCVIICGGIVGKYIVRHIAETFLELEYFEKSDGLFDCRIGYRSIQAIQAI